MRDNVKKSAKQTLVSFMGIMPILFGMLLLTSLVIELFPRQLSAGLFGKNNIMDVVLGSTMGGIAAGHPVLSYVLGGELLASGVSLFAVTALIVSWVTVGIVQLPAEALMLGKKFAIYRNLVCYISAMLLALLTVYTVQIFG